MNGFAWVMCVGFVLIISGLDYLKYFVDEKFWTGLQLVPILLLANVILGINTNLNVWYKVSDKTVYGIYITFVGLVITVVGNVILIPMLGILGAAFTTLTAYFAMFIASALWGSKHYPVPYRWKKIGAFVGFACLVVFILHYTNWPPGPFRVLGGIIYLGIMLFWERNGLLKFATRK
jgi:O-antigen/teichoic acid export membrane protein